jgi:hypothetical protein
MPISNEWTGLHSRLALKTGYWIIQQHLTTVDKHVEELGSTILEFTAVSVHKCVCQDVMWLASVRTETQIQVSSVTAMKILLL